MLKVKVLKKKIGKKTKKSVKQAKSKNHRYKK